jgi:hypothetical protein
MVDRAATKGHLALALRWRSVKAWTTDTQWSTQQQRQATAEAGGARQGAFSKTTSTQQWSTEQQQRGPRAGAALALGKGMDYTHTHTQSSTGRQQQRQAGSSSGRRAAAEAGSVHFQKRPLLNNMVDRAATKGHLALALRWRSVKAQTTDTQWSTEQQAYAGSSGGSGQAAEAVQLFKNHFCQTVRSIATKYKQRQQRTTPLFRGSPRKT